MSGVPQHFSHHTRPRWQWWIILVAAVVGLVCGTFGVHNYEQEYGEHVSWISSLYHAAQMFILHTPHFEHGTNVLLEIGRWSAGLAFGLTAFLALCQVYSAEGKHLLLPFIRNHVVVCGLGRKGIDLARCFRREGKKVVAIERTPTESVSRECARLGITLLAGDSATEAGLKAAGVARAARLIAICGDDSANVETAVRVQNFLEQQRDKSDPPLICDIHLSDADLRNSCQNANLLSDRKSIGFVSHFFDTFANTARNLLVDRDRLPLDRGGIAEEDRKQVHLVILGFGRMGRAVALQAALLGHFANGKRLRISVIDREANRHEAQLFFRYPAFKNVCDIEFHNLEVESPGTRALMQQWASDDSLATSVALCFDNDVLAMDVALRLTPMLREHAVPFAVRMSMNSGFASLLPLLKQSCPPAGTLPTCAVCGFGMLEDHDCVEAIENPVKNQLARAIHQTHVEEALQHGRSPSEQTLRPWDELDDDIKDSNFQQADHIDIKLRAIGCERAPLNNDRPEYSDLEKHVEVLAQMEHSRWNAERWLANWQLGPKQPGKKQSPHLVAWNELPDTIKHYDRQAVLRIPTFLRHIGEKVCLKKAF